MDVKRILCAVDGSEESIRAAAVGARLAEAMNAQMVCLYVIPYDLVFRLGIYRAEGERELRDEAETTMDEVAKMTSAPFERVVEEGDPSETILAEAEARSCDLIIIGNRGRGSVGRWLMGSVSSKVVTHAHCPVLVTRGLTDHADMSAHRFGTILCAIDGSAESREAAALSTGIAKAFQSRLHFGHVVETPDVMGYPDVGQDFVARQAHYSLELAKELTELTDSSGVPAEFIELSGHAAGEILEKAKEIKADLIAVGSRGLGGFLSLSLGSTSHQIVRHADCSVLVCPAKDGRE